MCRAWYPQWKCKVQFKLIKLATKLICKEIFLRLFKSGFSFLFPFRKPKFRIEQEQEQEQNRNRTGTEQAKLEQENTGRDPNSS
uniref:Uncharacterized protein n=1 Tax=Globodera rostochiensis TaxID=31243 RepID=A0A914HHQ3_GLORO